MQMFYIKIFKYPVLLTKNILNQVKLLTNVSRFHEVSDLKLENVRRSNCIGMKTDKFPHFKTEETAFYPLN